MRALLQRVLRASVVVEGVAVAEIDAGLLVLAGVGTQDTPQDAQRLADKIVQLRIFPDAQGAMNRSVLDTGGEVLAVSQFTLYATTAKGNRPGYTDAARPELARPLFDAFVAAMALRLRKPVPTGVFGADMQVSLVNDGPVTLWLDTRASTGGAGPG